MTYDNWISIISAVIVALGWFVNGHLNRIKDVSQKCLEHRLEALKSFLPVVFSIQDNSDPFGQTCFKEQLEKARSNFQLYGLTDEIELMESFIIACEKGSLDEANGALHQLTPLVRSRIRKELGLAA